MRRFPSKSNALRHLNAIGLKFGTIIDVGTHAETPELRIAFPHHRHVLFEPASEFFPKIATNYAGMNWELVPVAVSNADGQGRLEKIAISDGEISHSKLRIGDASAADLKLEGQGLGIIDIPTVRLDTFFRNRDEPKPYLVKIDVDGFEMPILQGAEGIWQDIDCVIIEATADTFVERLQFVMSKGFHIFDMIDQCYYAGVFSQMDIVLVSDRARRELPRLRPWETEEFAWNKWVPVANYEALLPKESSET